MDQKFGILRELEKKGSGEGRNRTADAEIFSLSLYRLSYLASDERQQLSSGVSIKSLGFLVNRKIAYPVIQVESFRQIELGWAL